MDNQVTRAAVIGREKERQGRQEGTIKSEKLFDIRTRSIWKRCGWRQWGDRGSHDKQIGERSSRNTGLSRDKKALRAKDKNENMDWTRHGGNTKTEGSDGGHNGTW